MWSSAQWHGEDLLRGCSSRSVNLIAHLHSASTSWIRDAIPWLAPDSQTRRLNKRWNKLTLILPPEHSNAERARNSKYLQNPMKAVQLVEDAWLTTEFSAVKRPAITNLQVVTVSSENSQCWRIAVAVFRYVVFFPTHYIIAQPTVITMPLQFYSMSHTSFPLPLLSTFLGENWSYKLISSKTHSGGDRVFPNAFLKIFTLGFCHRYLLMHCLFFHGLTTNNGDTCTVYCLLCISIYLLVHNCSHYNCAYYL